MTYRRLGSGLALLLVSLTWAGTGVVRAEDPYPGLGTFYPDRTVMIRGNGPAGGGYSPLGGDQMVMYGPFSPVRATSAPIVLYERGYNGLTVRTQGTVTSYPNYPRVAPVVYPTQATYFWGFRTSGTPPAWKSGIHWTDTN